MCVIAYKPVGVEVFTKETLQKCWEANDHGAGFAWWDATAGVWQVRKGFMTWKRFWKSFKTQQFQADDCVVAHFRIGTSGLKDGGSTHPFPITNDLPAMRQLDFTADSILFHNGVVGKGEGDYSDTMIFVRDYIAPVIPLLGMDDRIPKILEKICDGASRFLITKGPALWRFGHTWVERQGCFFSNGSWEYKRSPIISSYTGGSTTTSIGNGIGFTGNYGAGVDRKWRHHRGMANEFGRYINGQWRRWDEDDDIFDFSKATDNGGLVDFSKSKKTKKEKGCKESKDKEDHLRTRTLFAVVGDDGSVKFSDKAREYIRKTGIKFLLCPECYEDKHVDDAPVHCLGTGGESVCLSCGAVFNDLTGEVIMYDLETRRRSHRRYDDIIRKPTTWGKLTAAERQVIIDAESDELVRTGNC